MIERIFGIGKTRINDYAMTLQENIPFSQYDADNRILSIFTSFDTKYLVDFRECKTKEAAKLLFSKQAEYIVESQKNLIQKSETMKLFDRVLTHQDNLMYPFKHEYSCEYCLLRNDTYMDFFKDIENFFSCNIKESDDDTNKFLLHFNYNYITDIFPVRIPVDNYMLERDIDEKFKENFLSLFVESCKDVLEKNPLSFNAYEQFNHSLEQFSKYRCSENCRKILDEAKKDFLLSKEDFVKYYKKNLEKAKKDAFEENIYFFKRTLKDIKTGKSKLSFSLNDLSEYGRILSSLDRMEYGHLSELQQEDYAKARNIAYLLGYEEEIIEENADKITFPNNKNCIIGEYFYIKENGGIMPNLEKFETLPEEFFEFVERVKERGNEQELNIDFSY